MDIRVLTPADYDAIHALWLACAGMGLNDVDDSRQGIERYLRRNPSTSFAAVEDGAVIGCILAGHDGRRGYIYHTAVHPDHRHRGAATALTEAALAALKAEGVSKAALVVFAHNGVGNAFWERMGFTVREDLTYRNLALRELVRHDT